MNAFTLALVMLLLMAAGYVARKTRIVDASFGESMAAFIFNLVFPALILRSMAGPYRPSELRNGLILMGICTGVMGLMYLAGTLVVRLDPRHDAMDRILRFSLVFPNYTFMAFPVMEALYGQQGLFYVSLYTLPMRIAFYLLGPVLMKAPDQEARAPIRERLRALLTPPVLTVPVALALYILEIRLPAPLEKSLDLLAAVATPMGMAVSGVLLADAPVGDFLRERRVALASLLRLVAAPALVFAILWPLHPDPQVFRVSVLFSAMPAAASTTIFAVRYRSDPARAAQLVFLSTVLSLLTVPLTAFLLERFVP